MDFRHYHKVTLEQEEKLRKFLEKELIALVQTTGAVKAQELVDLLMSSSWRAGGLNAETLTVSYHQNFSIEYLKLQFMKLNPPKKPVRKEEKPSKRSIDF